MRLIDADALMTRLTPEDFGTPDERWLPERDIARLIQMKPTIDLVRCRECKWKYLENAVWVCPFGMIIPNEDGFCSYGERREQ